MKKTLLSLTLVLTSLQTWGAKAYPMPVTVTQKDGTQLTIVLHGDEHMNYTTTTDGVLLYQEGTDYFIAETDDNGNLQKTSLLAHNAGQRTMQEIRCIGQQNRKRFYQQASSTMQKRRIASLETSSTLFPHVGTPTALVLLADFKDQRFKHDSQTTIAIFDQYLNANGKPTHEADATLSQNYGSVKEYFKAMSGGSFTPKFDVKALVHLSENMKDYGSGKDDNMGKFIPEVCRLANEAGVDFSQYDANNDGNVDLVYIIFAGYGQSYAGNSDNTIWPKSGTISGGTYDGKKVVRYGVHSELNFSPADIKKYFNGITQINGIGLFCHEFSHCMGMPDFYPTSSEAQNAGNLAMEFFDLMDSGEYTNNGYMPTPYTAWEREYAGWMTNDILDNTKEGQRITLRSLEDGGKGYLIFNDEVSSGNEFVFLQNNQQKGWHQALSFFYGNGMLVTHVDYDKDVFSLSYNSTNNTIGKSRMNVLSANGEFFSSYLVDDSIENRTSDCFKAAHKSALYPGTANIKNVESFKMNNGSRKLTKPLLNIQETNGIITFDFMKESEITQTIPAPAAAPTQNADNIVNILSNAYGQTAMAISNKTDDSLAELVSTDDDDTAYRITNFNETAIIRKEATDIHMCDSAHVDIYPLSDMEITLRIFAEKTSQNANVTNKRNNAGKNSIALKGKQWNAVDVSLEELQEGFNLTKAYGIGIAGGTGSETIYIDNAYFYIGKKESTGIADVKPTVTNIPADIFTLDGQRVKGSVQSLPRGIYIINKKKVVIP